MKKHFLCLAKSKKLNGRCVAGILMNVEGGKTEIQCDELGNPKWIRPVSKFNHGAIDTNIASQLELLSIYEIDGVESCPDGYQSENVYYNHPKYVKIKSISKKVANLDLCCDVSTSPEIFVNCWSSIRKELISQTSTSIKFVKVSNCSIYKRSRENRTDQHRMKFTYNGASYDLPMTDLEFKKVWENDNEVFNKFENCYISISIGIEFNDTFYKLVAGVIIV